jgi:hypothetical protein
MTDEQLRYQIAQLNAKNDVAFRIIGPEVKAEADQLAALYKTLGERRTSFIDTMFAGSDAGKIQRINEQLVAARNYLTDPALGGSEESKLQEIVRALTADLEKLISSAGNSVSEIDRMAARWKEAWSGVWEQFQAEQSIDPFAGIDLEHRKKLEDAHNNYVRDANKETVDQINAYYSAQRSKTAKQLKDEEERIALDLSETQLDNLEYEFRKALENIDLLEQRRIIAAAGSEEEITDIRKKAAAMRQTLEENYNNDSAKTRLEEARQGIVDWQQSIDDTFTRLFTRIPELTDKAAASLGDLSAQFAALSASAALSGFEEFGRALGEGENAANSMKRALTEMAQQILRQLPMMFLQAGLQLIAQGYWGLGLGFIAAAGSTAIMSGFVDGATGKAKKEAEQNAKGGVYDECGRAAREYAAGGAFTNRVFSRPTYFRYGGGLGVMGEAGPEAIMPLTRGNDGRLGVAASGMAGGGTAVYVIIQNYTSEEVRTEESSDSSGNQIRKIIIGAVKQSIVGGEMDQPRSSRYGLRARGV